MELTLSHKLQIAFILAVFGASGFMFFRNTRTPPDMTINSWTEQRRVPMDTSRPWSATLNPTDPQKSPVVTVFANYDGKLEIAEYPPETGAKATIRFKPDQRRETFNAYQSPWERVEGIKDPYKKTLTLAAYSAAENRPMGLLGSARMDSEQRKAERELRQAMLDQVTLVDEGATSGTFSPELYDKVMLALEKYRSVEGDPTKDPKKAQLAHEVMTQAMKYLAKASETKAEAVDTYIAGVDKIFTEEQKAKLGEAGKELAADRRFGRRPARAG